MGYGLWAIGYRLWARRRGGAPERGTIDELDSLDKLDRREGGAPERGTIDELDGLDKLDRREGGAPERGTNR